jgi:hypothetical protein
MPQSVDDYGDDYGTRFPPVVVSLLWCSGIRMERKWF